MINKILDFLKKSIDLILMVLVIFFLICDLIPILTSLIEIFSKLVASQQQWQENFVSFMVENSNNTSHVTNVKIIHSDGGWANGVRSIFIYGTGVLRLSLLKAGGSPTYKAFVIGSTIAAVPLPTDCY